MSIQVDFTKKMDNFILKVDFTIGNETLALLGASGSGKSMTLKCIAGIETPDHGRILLDGEVLFDSEKGINLPSQERKIGYLFQNYALFPNMTVEGNIQSAMRLSKQDKKARTEEIIKTFHLVGLEKKIPRELSGGQQQRVAIARMLASEPKIIMLDEPFSALDSFLKWQLEQEILDIINQYNKPTLFVSHNQDEVYRISHKIGIMEKGTLVSLDKKEELFKNPKTLSGARLTGCKNFVKVQRISDRQIYVSCWDRKITLTQTIPYSNDLYIGLRAHDLYLIQSHQSKENVQEKETDVESIQLTCKVVKVVENTYSVILQLSTLNSLSHSVTEVAQKEKDHVEVLQKENELWLEMDKKNWLDQEVEVITIAIDPHKILLVQGQE